MPDISAGIAPELTALLSPLINLMVLIVFGWTGIRCTNRLILDVIQEAGVNTNFKKFLSNLLTQAGVVSALLLSIEIPMVQLQVPATSVPGTVLWDVYYGTCYLSTGFSIQGVCSSVLALAYIQGLDSAGALNFLAHAPDVIGFTISSMALAAYLLILQTTLYFILTASSYYMVIYIFVASFVCVYNITSAWVILTKFENKEVTKEQKRARTVLLGMAKTRTWGDWISSCFKKTVTTPIVQSQVGFARPSVDESTT